MIVDRLLSLVLIIRFESHLRLDIVVQREANLNSIHFNSVAFFYFKIPN